MFEEVWGHQNTSARIAMHPYRHGKRASIHTDSGPSVGTKAMQVNTATQQQTYDASRNPERNDPAPKPMQTPSSHAPETRARARGAQGRSPGQDAAAAPPRASQPAVATPSAPGQPGGYHAGDATTSPGA